MTIAHHFETSEPMAIRNVEIATLQPPRYRVRFNDVAQARRVVQIDFDVISNLAWVPMGQLKLWTLMHKVGTPDA